MNKEDEWEVAELHHDNKHFIKLSIRKDSKYRDTYCMTCGEPRRLEKVLKEPNP